VPVRHLHGRGRDTVWSVLEGHAERTPESPFLLFERSPGDVLELSWRRMAARVERTAAALTRLGVGHGDRFNVHLENGVEFYDLWLAAARLGAVVVPTNPLSTADELAYILGHSRSRLTITQPNLLATAEAARAQAPICERALVAGEPMHEEAVGLGAGTGERGAAPRSPEDVLGVLYTSGTTSRPKGVLITHAAYLHVGDVVASHLRLRPDDRQLIVLPLFHGNAQYYSTCSALVTGASIALAPRFSASRWSEQAAAMGATVGSLFAAPIRMILAQKPSVHDRSHGLRVVMFAQNVTDEQVGDFETRFGTPLIQLYGMTETVAPPTMNPLYEGRRGSSIGRPIPTARLRIVDESGADVGPGEEGGLLVGGEPGLTLMAGYLDDPDATARALRDGWLETGDTVRADEDGYLYFVDRRKDMIKRAGENVASAEVERVVNDHPAVFESAVVGVPDEMRDEAIHVFVVLKDGSVVSADELIDWCSARLSKFKVPNAVRIVESLPRTSVGKIQKHLLRGELLSGQRAGARTQAR
jgi:crotonobetaine/carnitine-CoA ligase